MPASAVAPMPANLGFAEAAAIPLVGLTAWQSLFDAAGVRAGQTVLIHAAGGVGGMAIQFAKSVGAFVFATASAANHDYVRSLGADRVIDYRVEDFVDAVRSVVLDGVDAVLATVGGEVLARSYDAVKRGGVLVSIVDAPNGERAKETGVRHAYVFVEPNGDQLREIARLIETGRVRPPAITEMRLEDAATAQIRSREGHVRGKIVLKIA